MCSTAGDLPGSALPPDQHFFFKNVCCLQLSPCTSHTHAGCLQGLHTAALTPPLSLLLQLRCAEWQLLTPDWAKAAVNLQRLSTLLASAEAQGPHDPDLVAAGQQALVRAKAEVGCGPLHAKAVAVLLKCCLLIPDSKGWAFSLYAGTFSLYGAGAWD